VVEESQVEGRADGIFETLLEDDMSTVITRMKGVHDIGGVIGDAIVVTLHVARLRPNWGRWLWLVRRLWMALDVRPRRSVCRSLLPFARLGSSGRSIESTDQLMREEDRNRSCCCWRRRVP
jgi:hypothetical protein